MSPGMSPEFRQRRFNSSAPATSGTVPNAPTGTAGQSTAAAKWSPIPAVLFIIAVVLVMAGVLTAVLPNIKIPFPSNTPTPDETSNSATAVATPPIGPTVISVAIDCPAGCVVPVVVPVPVVVQPAVVFVSYPMVYEQVRVPPHGSHAGYGYERYEPVTYGDALCPTQSVYVVQPGDTVFRLARWFGVDPHAIVEANGLWNPNLIQIGQVLSIPCAPAIWHGYP